MLKKFRCVVFSVLISVSISTIVAPSQNQGTGEGSTASFYIRNDPRHGDIV
ncbi:hypothetical protein SAMN04488134_105103 [Amphibacillus marinus]|uniref:Uncharacterized protein n=1 Tax=Amphibacillus marinus TaxID=872970 RepID=A0A1H8N384_9BACI|nr:hypothetical protein SAMN04488134_105103 [Amphibacillus marinus]